MLQNRKEIEEPYGAKQIGSSAMAYKRNPMRAERMCSLARFAMSLTANADHTMATQWMERTLDDSANALYFAQSFPGIVALSVDLLTVTTGLVVNPKVIEKNLMEELPFMATEEILMAAVQAGGDRQELHEVIRQHSVQAAAEVKQHGRLSATDRPPQNGQRLHQHRLSDTSTHHATSAALNRSTRSSPTWLLRSGSDTQMCSRAPDIDLKV
ncbi:MAG: hypothetical protein R3B91_19495 [Planctomycetaceae bacterium]